ncbi:low-density lipoprotein receptor-related protein 4-like isoform X1 [Dreissena polymorpha]|uniref:low-density lipoprotein receptor-related protein 4-like isoform X1 n=1 Tax=Dreissena polymorpha TaxID=45954 RepID=UPI00226435A3|nr:low-density lipoprotein receptor-related protein 4-like isoform X1 [Dreissena polymorpha]XP_052224398.1 low-density lipoprotein receptor-related protein 4-like isoform X1 [Dreissena polymorpha]
MNMGRTTIMFVLFAVKVFLSATANHYPDPCSPVFDASSSVPRCSQICRSDDKGQRKCSCTAGYALADDGLSCIVLGHEPFLLYSTGSALRSFYVDSHLDMPLIKTGANISAFAFGVDKQVFLADASTLTVYSVEIDDPAKRKTFIDTGLYSVSSMAADLLTGNMYVSDPKQGRVFVCATKSSVPCSVVLDNLKNPHSVIVDTINRSLLWSEAGSGNVLGSISTARMDGSERRVLVDRLVQPSALALDSLFQEIYWLEFLDVDWIDGTPDADHVIKAMKLDGSRQIRTVFSMSNFQNPTFSLLSDTIYISEGRRAFQVNKWNRQTMPMFDGVPGVIYSSSIYHPILCKMTEDETTSTPCKSDPCSHICVPISNREPNDFRCLCPPGLKLDNEGECIPDDDAEVLVVACQKGLYQVPVDYVGLASERAECIVSGDIDVIVHEPNSRRVVFHDADENEITVADIDHLRHKKVLFSAVQQVEGMAVDISSRVLLWTNKNGEITVGKLDGTMSRIIVKGLGRIRGITLDSTSGLMYITEWGNSSRIIQCNIDGQSCITLVTIPDGHPNDIVMDTRDMGIILDPYGRSYKLKTLFWSDSKQDVITVWPLDVFAKQTGFPLTGYRNPHPYAMSLSDDNLYFTDLNSGLLHFVEMPDSRTHLSGTVQNISLGLGTLYGLAVVRRNTKDSEHTRCLVNNGGCSHVCLASPGNGRTCLCPSDLELSPDGKTCTVDGRLPPTTPSESTTHPLLITASGPHQDNEMAPSRDNHDKLMLSLILTSCISVAIVVILGLVFCFNKTKKRQRQLMDRLSRFIHRRSDDDHVKLFDDEHSQSPSFKHFDDLDYPCESLLRHRNDVINYHEMSLISMDSAFNEMGECDLYSSIVDLSP